MNFIANIREKLFHAEKSSNSDSHCNKKLFIVSLDLFSRKARVLIFCNGISKNFFSMKRFRIYQLRVAIACVEIFLLICNLYKKNANIFSHILDRYQKFAASFSSIKFV